MAQKLAPAEKIAQIYLPHLPLFASLLQVQLRFLTEEEKRAKLEERRLKSETPTEVCQCVILGCCRLMMMFDGQPCLIVCFSNFPLLQVIKTRWSCPSLLCCQLL